MNTWKGISFALRGKSHLLSGESCQDFTAIYINDRRACCVLCDGAGSAKHSLSATYSIGNYTINLFSKSGIPNTQDIIKKLKERLELLAKKKKSDIKEFSSTFLAVFIDDDSYKAIHIGDGLIGILKEKEISAISTGYKGEFSNETVFITSENIFVFESEGKLSKEGIHGFVLMSDGMQQALFDKQVNRFGNLVYKIDESLKQHADPKKLKRVIKRKGKHLFYQRTLDDLSMSFIRRVDL